MINNTAFTSVTATSPQANGPGGNPIVPTPATPGNFPKMLLAIAVVGSGLWFLSSFNEKAATYLAIIILMAIVTYYELHGNHQFSSGLTDLTKAIPGW